MEKQTIYLAGPLFTQGEWLWNEQLAQLLREAGHRVFLPQEDAVPMLQGEQAFDPSSLFYTNLHHIHVADVVVAIFDQPDPDSGTSWECGYAYGCGKPVLGVRTDLRFGGDTPDGAVNLMLQKGAHDIILVPLNRRGNVKWLAEQIVARLAGWR